MHRLPLTLLVALTLTACASHPRAATVADAAVDAAVDATANSDDGHVSQSDGAVQSDDLGITARDLGVTANDAGVADSGAADAGSADGGAPRDWSTYPAIVDVPQPNMIYAVSDIHGGFARFGALLAGNGIIASASSDPTAWQWTAGTAALVVTGDLIDKGPQGLEVIDALITLQTSAISQGGQVIVTLGNHEAEFLADPENSKATGTDGIDVELANDHITPEDVAAGNDMEGVWLRNLPFGAHLDRWFFSHAGDTGGHSVGELETMLESAVSANGYSDPAVIGSSSILESRDWYSASSSTAADNASALGVVHIVFGHTPSALGARGAIATSTDGVLYRIDCGLSPDVDDSTGRLLRIHIHAGTESVDELDPSGHVRALTSELIH